MRKRALICGMVICMALGMCACSDRAEEGKESGVSAPTVGVNEGTSAESDDEDLPEESDSKKAPALDAEKEPENSPEPGARSREEEGIDFVGINAHVKEINGNSLLISSDSDDFPGAFTVTCADEMQEFSDLQGGTFIQILMQRLEEEDEQGLPKYKAERIVILSEDEEEVQEDILLTEVPVFVLRDALSSRMDDIELIPGNYSWNVETGDEGSGVVACGAAPLDEAAMDFTVKLKLPEYNGLDSVAYVFSTKIAPDTLVVRRWDASAIGNGEAEEERVTKYYYRSPILELEPGKVYEFAADWKKESAGKNKFYGNASYVLVTE